MCYGFWGFAKALIHDIIMIECVIIMYVYSLQRAALGWQGGRRPIRSEGICHEQTAAMTQPDLFLRVAMFVRRSMRELLNPNRMQIRILLRRLPQHVQVDRSSRWLQQWNPIWINAPVNGLLPSCREVSARRRIFNMYSPDDVQVLTITP